MKINSLIQVYRELSLRLITTREINLDNIWKYEQVYYRIRIPLKKSLIKSTVFVNRKCPHKNTMTSAAVLLDTFPIYYIFC